MVLATEKSREGRAGVVLGAALASLLFSTLFTNYFCFLPLVMSNLTSYLIP